MSTTILVLAALLLLVIVVLRNRTSQSSQGHNHDHDHDGDGEFIGTPDEISSIHAGKDEAGGCKFDPEEVRATAFAPKPPIDMDNIPAPDPRVAALLNEVDEAWMRELLMKLSGELPAKVNGREIMIRTRNSLTGDDGINLGMEFVEMLYKSHGIAVRRVPYKVWGRTYFNLEATIPGRMDAKTVLVLGSHLDSTAGRTRSKETYAPGAEDDGSGTIGMVQTAIALSKLPLDYTVRIVHFTGEEQGLWGSYAYSDQLADEVKADGVKVIAMLQHDMIGYSPNEKKRLDVHDEMDRNGSRSLLVAYFRNVKRYGIDLNPFDTYNYAVKNRSDHAGFLDNGFRAIMFSEEFTDENFYPWYHTTNDRVSNLNLPFFVEVIKGAIALSAELDFRRSNSQVMLRLDRFESSI